MADVTKGKRFGYEAQGAISLTHTGNPSGTYMMLKVGSVTVSMTKSEADQLRSFLKNAEKMDAAYPRD